MSRKSSLIKGEASNSDMNTPQLESNKDENESSASTFNHNNNSTDRSGKNSRFHHPSNTQDKNKCSDSKKEIQSISKSDRIKDYVLQTISSESKSKIATILSTVNKLSDVEKMTLYLQLPTGAPSNYDPLKQKIWGNPLGKKADVEVAQTHTWIQSHLEEDKEVSLPKQEIYQEYQSYCQSNNIETLCAADFGKVMKFAFPSVKPRRLGTRGNSRYCYSGLRKRTSLALPSLPDLGPDPQCQPNQAFEHGEEDDELSRAANSLIFEWAEKLLGHKFVDLRELALHLVDNTYVDDRSVAAFTLLSSSQKDGIITLHSPKLEGTISKRRETQLQIQRKLQEKEMIREQKKRMLQGSRINQCKKKKDSSLHSDITLCTSSIKENFTASNKVEVKEEQAGKPVRSYSEGSLSLSSRAKLPISRKSPLSCFPSSIIILPAMPIHTQKPPMEHQSPKYKRIQPKPDPPLSNKNSKGDLGCSRNALEGGKIKGRGASNLKGVKCLKNIEIKSKRPYHQEKNVQSFKKPHLESSNDGSSSGEPSPKMDGDNLQGEVSIHQIESEALLDYLQGDAPTKTGEEHKPELLQLRLLLEKNLPQVVHHRGATSMEGTPLQSFSCSGLSELRQAMVGNKLSSSFRSKSEPYSILLNETPKLKGNLEVENLEKDSIDDNVLETVSRDSELNPKGSEQDLDDRKEIVVVPPLDKLLHATAFTQLLSVPPSPNTRRRAFNFMPISPGQTPVQETPDFGLGNPGMANSTGSPIFNSSNLVGNIVGVSVGVGPSQPPSTASSPFVSPRGTPVPTVRSRHNSGQSAFSTPRQTPGLHFTDSGVSSISTSPFVSPQTTPVPLSRLRHNSNHHTSQGKTVTFSSIAQPVAQQQQQADSFRARHNSGPLPPLPYTHSVGTSALPTHFTSTRSAPLSPLVGESFTFNPEPRSTTNLNITPLSPLSAPVSPGIPSPASAHMIGPSDPLVGSTFNQIARPIGLRKTVEWTANQLSTVKPWPVLPTLRNSSPWSSVISKRNRHVSGSVIHHRPSSGTGSSDPLAQEIQALLPASSSPTVDHFLRSRSVPLQRFPGHANSVDLYTLKDFNVQNSSSPSGRHFGKSLRGGPGNDWLSENHNARRNISDLLEQPTVEDDLQMTLEDLRDCDNDYSKFAQELEQMDPLVDNNF